MPLDTGAVAQGADVSFADEGVVTALTDDNRSLGAALQAARIARGLTIDQVSLSTRIRPRHLEAIEAMRLAELPSPPFSTGYVRAFATAVGLDGEAAAARFRLESPGRDEPLRAPPGVRAERHPGLRLVGLAVVVVGTGVLIWNIAQHGLVGAAVAQHRVASAPTATARLKTAPVQGTLALGAPLPPPPEATTPQPYVTPGLAAASGASPAASSAPPVSTDPTDQAGAPFVAKGAVYGVPASQSDVVLQAKTAASVIVHGADGTVYFARHLAPGEAYRAPRMQALVISAPEPGAIRVFVGGALKGPLMAADTPLSKLAG